MGLRSQIGGNVNISNEVPTTLVGKFLQALQNPAMGLHPLGMAMGGMTKLGLKGLNQIGTGKVSPALDVEALQQLMRSAQPAEKAVQNVAPQSRGVSGLADALREMQPVSFKDFPLLVRGKMFPQR